MPEYSIIRIEKAEENREMPCGSIKELTKQKINGILRNKTNSSRTRHGYEATNHEAEAGTKPSTRTKPRTKPKPPFKKHKAEDEAEATLSKTHEAEVEAKATLLKTHEAKVEATCITGFIKP